jgi:long-chain acyl-CoA synthetase
MLDAYQATVARYPTRTAIQYFDKAITFRELDGLTDALAAGLQSEGFEPGERLAVYLQNVPQFVIAMLATWKAGGMPWPRSRPAEPSVPCVSASG